MRFPNGYGSVYKMHGNRRKPWTARITVSYMLDDIGSPKLKYKYLGYYKTQAEALAALVKYNENPLDLDADKITFAEVFEKWSAEHYPKISKSNIVAYNSSYKICQPIHNTRFKALKRRHLQSVIDGCGKNYPMLIRVKLLYNVLFKYALQNDIVEKDYSKFIDIAQYKDRVPVKYEHAPFSAAEIDMLWSHSGRSEASIILMLIYTGVRISELLNLKKENVNLFGNRFDITSAKTSSGVRCVPIASKVWPFFEAWYNKSDSEYLLTSDRGKPLSYACFTRYKWQPFLEELGMAHRPHDTRHTCITLLTAANVDDKIIKRIVGHRGNDVTDVVYTHYEPEQLLEAINRI